MHVPPSAARLSVRLRLAAPLLACLLLAAPATMAAPASAAQPDRPFTVDEMLRLKSLGGGVFSPDGALLVYVERPPYEDRPDFSTPYHWGAPYGQLMQVSTSGAGPATPLLPIDPKAQRALVGFSPDGRYVAYLEAREGRLSLGVLDRQTGTTKQTAETPQQNLVHDLAPIWIGPGRLLFAASEPGELPPFEPYVLRGIQIEQTRKREQAWRGKEPTPAVFRSRPDGGSNPDLPGRLVAFDAATGQSRVWSQGLYSDLRLSPDGRYVAAVHQAERSQLPADGLGSGWTWGRGRLDIYRVEDGVRIDVAPDLDLHSGTAEWSPDSRRVGFFGWKAGDIGSTGVFRVFDVASRKLTPMPHTGLDLVNEREFGPPGRPMRFVWTARGIAVAARPNPDGSAEPRFSPRGPTGRDMNQELGRLDWYALGEGTPRNLTSGFKTVSPWPGGATAAGGYLVLDDQLHRLDARGVITPVKPGRRIAAEALDITPVGGLIRRAYQDVVVYEGLDKAQSTAFDLRDGRSWDMDLSKTTGEMMAWLPEKGLFGFRDVRPRGTDLVIRRAGEAPRVVATINGQLEQIALPKNRKISYPGADGKTIFSCLTLPADAVAGRRYPTLIYVYPSSSPRCAETPNLQSLSYGNLNMFTPYGYAILTVAAPMIATPEGGPLANLVPAIDRAIDAAVADGQVDGDRLGMIGASGAGYSGLWTVGHSKRIKALVSINGISNLYGHYFDVDEATPVYPLLNGWVASAPRYEGVDQFGLGVSVWEDPALYWRGSPIAYVPAIEAPILLVGSDLDSGGFSNQYDDMFVALNRHRKTVDYIRYWGETHGPSSPANIRDLTARSRAWFDRYVVGKPDAPSERR
ncbi:MAG: S9 family peptidase [Caulobacter sp.]|nr:S9 family peptidase [Caulobacter sp.]